MRIVSGIYKGKIIIPPKNLAARPTTDFAKESLFNILANRVDFEEISVLDLFSGTGGISFEFASRGCPLVTSVEINAIHQAYIRKTATELKLPVKSLKANAFLYIKNCKESFDLVFADPPYDLPELPQLPDLVLAHNLLKPDGLFVLEHPKTISFEQHPLFIEHRYYGSVNFSFFKPAIETENLEKIG